jgi:hypothetical protein
MSTSAFCESCRSDIHPDDRTVQGEAVIDARLDPEDEPVPVPGRVFLFHAECWGAGLSGYKEIDRGLLSDVQARR